MACPWNKRKLSEGKLVKQEEKEREKRKEGKKLGIKKNEKEKEQEKERKTSRTKILLFFFCTK